MAINRKKASAIVESILYLLGKPVDIAKLTKLIYLVERESILNKGFSISSDPLVSMNHGPLTSITYDDLKEIKNDSIYFGRVAREGNKVILIDSPETSSLSKFENSIVKKIVELHGKKGTWELIGYCHDNLPEYEDPKGSSRSIRYETLVEQIDTEDEKKEILLDRINTGKFLDSLSV